MGKRRGERQKKREIIRVIMNSKEERTRTTLEIERANNLKKNKQNRETEGKRRRKKKGKKEEWTPEETGAWEGIK